MPHPEIASLVNTLLDNETDYDRAAGLGAIIDYLRERETLTPHIREFMDFARAVKTHDIFGITQYIDNHKIFISPHMLLACPVAIQEYHTLPPFLFYAVHYAASIEDALIYADNINEADFYGRTLLMIASKNGDINTVSLLLKHGADIFAKDKNGNTACMLAALSGHGEIARLLIKHGANINQINSAGDNVVHIALRLNNPTRIRALCRLGASIDNVNNDNLTPLMLAAIAGSLPMLQQILLNGANIYRKNSDTMNAFLFAAKHGCTDILSYFIKGFRSLIKDTDYFKNNAFMLACASRNLSAVMLLRPYFDVNAVNIVEKQALMYARGKTVVEYLLTEGANIHAQDTMGSTALMSVAEDGDTETTATLLDNGAVLEETNKEGMNALLISAESGNTAVLEFFIKRDPKVLHTTAPGGITAFMLAANSKNAQAVRLLLPYFDIHTRDADGQTALMYARGKAVVELLLEEGAEINATDNKGNTAILYSVKRFGCRGTFDALIHAKADLNTVNQAGETALMAAIPNATITTNGFYKVERLMFADAKPFPFFVAMSPFAKRIKEIIKLIKNQKIVIQFFSRVFNKLGSFFPALLLDFTGYGNHSKVISIENTIDIINTQHRCALILEKRATRQKGIITAEDLERVNKKQRIR